jgi:hypothetical protein
MKLLILGVFAVVLLAVASGAACFRDSDGDWRWRDEMREQTRQAVREARDQARQAREMARDQARQIRAAQREAWRAQRDAERESREEMRERMRELRRSWDYVY